MNYNQFLEFMNGKGQFHINLGLERITALLEKIDSPQKELKIIHVAGTNGKGSTCAMISSILQEAGYKVGLYTSPHLRDYRERFRINGREAEKDDLVDCFEKIRLFIKDETFFEIATAIAFLYFKEQNVDFAVIEVGLGGRLDATNVVNPLISVITMIDYEHTEHLGKTIKEIAYEKAGIIKQEGYVITSTDGDALEVINKVCRERNAKLIIARPSGMQPNLLGDFQRINAGMAIKTIKTLNKYFGRDIPKKVIINGLRKVKWPGRLEYLEQDLLVDCAHNPSGAHVLADFIRTLDREIILVVGISKEKNIKEMMKELAPIANKIIITKANNERAAEPKQIAKYCDNPKIIEHVKEAVEYAKKIREKNELVVVTGSIFVVGEVY